MSCQDFCPPFDHYCAVALHLVCHYYMLSSVCSAFQLSARAFSIRHGKNNQKLTNLGQVVSCRVGEKTVYWILV